MSRQARAGTATLMLAFVLAVTFPAGAETRTLTADYIGFTLLERTACNGVLDPGMACFPLTETGTNIQITISDVAVPNVMGVGALHYANGESNYLERFCGSVSAPIYEDHRGPPAYLTVSVEPHGPAGCEFPTGAPVAGTIAVTLS